MTLSPQTTALQKQMAKAMTDWRAKVDKLEAQFERQRKNPGASAKDSIKMDEDAVKQINDHNKQVITAFSKLGFSEADRGEVKKAFEKLGKLFDDGVQISPSTHAKIVPDIDWDTRKLNSIQLELKIKLKKK